ncbi:MAG: TonB-dependent receptor [Sphingobium sp.]
MSETYCRRAILLASTAISIAAATPALAQDNSSDIIVTARRIEERLQDVPISITVFSQETLTNNNVQSAKDLATYTPGLTTNNRYGADNTTWTIRGFTQEQRTTSTVGTYFADVVAPRGSGATQGGDGAGPGQLFDLQNVQVLKGPQGTLFGRNSTGGAVLLVPRKPTDRLEGYVEGSIGDYDMWRGQGVLNLPVMDTLRLRFGVDRSKRDGYLKNAGRIGAGPYGDAMGSVDYTALRLSAVADLTPDIENYTIASYSKSRSTGVIPKITKCYAANPCAQVAREAALDFFTVSNPLPDAQSVAEQWQLINTTTWQASDSLTIKNIAAYGEFRGITNIDLFGQYRPVVTPGTETTGNQVQPFALTHNIANGYTNAQSSFVEELQFQGRPGDGKLIWQAGLYLELNEPLGRSGVQTATFTPCSNLATFDCRPGDGGLTSLGRIAYSTTRTSYRGMAAYAQASYDISDKLKFTAGIRYTADRVRSNFQIVDIRLNPAPLGNYATCTNTPTFGAANTPSNPRRPIDQRFDMCFQDSTVKTSAPTWLIGLDYKPLDDVLLYAKWSRGYRQGGVAAFGADRLQNYKDETVDTYEVGAKTSWRGALPGNFNIAGFYNDFRNQQIQLGFQCNPVSLCTQTTSILNVGSSELYGFEAEVGVRPFQGFRIDAAYAYLKTRILAVEDATPAVVAAGLPFNDIRPPKVGDVIPNAMPHKVNVTASYTLPLPESIGKISVGGTFVYQSSVRVVTDAVVGSNNGVLPNAKYGNVNVNWQDVAGLPVDAGFFMTNITNERIYLHANDQQTNGFVSNIIGEPRMYGFRLKYRFGG